MSMLSGTFKHIDTINDLNDHHIFKDRLLYGFLWIDRNFNQVTPDVGYIEVFQKTSISENGTHIDDSVLLELDD